MIGAYDRKLEQIKNLADFSRYIEGRHGDQVRLLNDRLRTTGQGGIVLITGKIAALEIEAAHEILRAVAEFSDFGPENDPNIEHDCAALTVSARRVIWKIDYYDRSRRIHSPDPADPNVTVRVMTVLLADEY